MCTLGVALALKGPGPFMVCIAIGMALLFSNTSAIGIGTMASVPPETRSFAIGLSTLMIHALGKQRELCNIRAISSLRVSVFIQVMSRRHRS